MYGSFRGDGLTSASVCDAGDASVWDFGWRSTSPGRIESRPGSPGSPGAGTGPGATGSRTIGRLARFHMARRDREKAQHCSSLQRTTLAIQDRFEDMKPPMRIAIGMVVLPNIVAGITLLTFQLTCTSFCNRDRRLQMLNYEMGVAEILLGVCLSAVCIFLCGVMSDELNNAVVTELWKEVGRHWSVVMNLLVDVEIHHNPRTRVLLMVCLACIAVFYILAYIVYLRMVHLIGFRFVDVGSMHVHCQGLKCIYHQCAFVNTVQLLVVATSMPYFFYGKSHARQRMEHAASCIQARWRDLNRRCRQLFRERLASGNAKPKSPAKPVKASPREETKVARRGSRVRFDDDDVEAPESPRSNASAETLLQQASVDTAAAKSLAAVEKAHSEAKAATEEASEPTSQSSAPAATDLVDQPNGEASEVLSADAAAGDATASEILSYRRG